MIRILFFCLLQALLLAGAGALAQRLLWGRQRFNIWETAWFGMGIVVTLVQIWHLILPVNQWCAALVSLLGLVGLRELWKAWPARGVSRADLLFWSVAVFFVSLLVGGHLAVERIEVWDTRMYHLNVVRWNNEFAAVPGLANLHQRLGVNSTWLLYAALVDVGWADGRSAWLVAGLPLLLLMGQWSSVLILHHGRQSIPGKIYCILTFPFLAKCLANLTPNLYYDTPPLLLLLVVGLHLLRTGWLQKATAMEEWIPSATLVLTLAALAFTLKASSAMSLVVLSAIIVVHWWRVSRRGLELAKVWAPATLLVIGYMASNLITSGWPLFPMPLLGMPFDWAQPAEDVRSFRELVSDWARVPGAKGLALVRAGFWEWWPVWLGRFAQTTEYMVGVIALLMSLVAAWRVIRGDARLPWAAWVVFAFLCLALGNVLFWLTSAPDLRFGDGFFYYWLGVSGAVLLAIIPKGPRGQLVTATVMAVGLLGWLQPNLLPGKEVFVKRMFKARAERTVSASAPGTPTILVPTQKEGFVGDCQLPSAPVLDPRLRSRVEGNLGAGFRLDRSVEGGSMLAPR